MYSTITYKDSRLRMTTFTTSDREEAEKELYKTPIVPCGVGELPQMAVKILEADEPIPFFGWLKDNEK